MDGVVDKIKVKFDLIHINLSLSRIIVAFAFTIFLSLNFRGLTTNLQKIKCYECFVYTDLGEVKLQRVICGQRDHEPSG